MRRDESDPASPIIYLPTPAQVELRECKVKKLLWGGAAGGAKSHGLRWDAYHWCRTIANYEVILLRRTFPELQSTHLLRMQKEAESVGATYKAGDKMLVWPNGSFIKAGHCESTGDMSKMLSTEYDDIRIDEGSTFEPVTIREITSRARTSKPEVHARGGAFGRITSNPGGVGSLFLRDLYIDKVADPDEVAEYDPNDYAFIPARVSDNPYLDPSYAHELTQLDPTRRDQLLNGDWNVFGAQFFGQWDARRHVGTV